MSTRDQGAYRAAGSTHASTEDFPIATDPYPAQARATSTGSIVAPHPDQRPATDRAEDRRDRVRWGPIWAGAAVVLTVFIVLQLLFFALGWLDLGLDGRDGSGVAAGVVTGVLALIAFFVGGLTAGASTIWRTAGDGMLHGVLVWTLSVLGILALTLIGGTALLGPLASVASQAPDAAQAAQQAVDPARALDTARDTAGWAALGLGAAAAAAAVGGIAGSRLWRNREDSATGHRTPAA
ncbi:hypothetical protein FHX44_114865 [Pseudonocardia hierapolitana]|uniref:Uncharacterized protein n=1 Tax=Pseudonocardia hierapolitana TaxID=1128676 RepID=A0A561SVS9_9PSEU|nr:permease [Pseudonocardia hierapolitana]TWF78941.1 hypothetical protein FHX44_114865 [Pseudonocardia hierapolitana]